VVAVAEVLGERYEFLSRIAAGGMGEVWRGRDLRLQRDVAIKVLRAEHADDPDFRARLHAEARSAGALNCDSCVDVYDYGEQTDEAGRFLSYVVMELVEGDTVAQLIARDGALGTDRTARILTDTAAGLAAAERRGLVHRDIKPANLLVTSEGRVKIADFGIARAANGVAITRAGTMVGTATYVSPEQVQGDPATSASDVYSLGVVAYECLAGVPPFRADGEIATAIARVNATPPVLPSSVPQSLSGLVAAMLDPDPARRPSAAEVARRTDVVDADVAVQPVVPTAVLPVLPLPTTTLPMLPMAAAAAAVTTDLTVPEPRRARLASYLRRQPAVLAVLGLVLLAVLIPTVTSAGPSPMSRVTASLIAANNVHAAAAAKQRAATSRTTTQGQDTATTRPVKQKASPKPKPKPPPPGHGGPGPGHGHGGGGDGGDGGGDGGPGHGGDGGG
jgi:eukaryotic-like serine/threonine-protein kinase